MEGNSAGRPTHRWAIVAAVLVVALVVWAPAALARNAYVPSFTGDNVTVIDTATNTTVGSPIAVGDAPVAMAITPDGTRLYVTAVGSDNVTVIDTATNTTVGSPIAVGNNPYAIAITPDGSRAYVVNQAGTVSVIDTATNTTVGSPIPVGNGPLGIAITPDGTRAYVTNNGAPYSVSVIDIATNTTGSPIPMGTSPIGIAITPDGTRAYVAHQGPPGEVRVIDTATNTTVGSPIPVSNAQSIGIAPDGDRAYVGTGAPGVITTIDTAANATVGAPIATGDDVMAFAFTPDGSRAYAAVQTNRVFVIDTATNTAGTPITVPTDPEGIAIVPDQGPVAAFTASPDPARAGQTVGLDGAGSSDPDGTIARFDWDFGDGSTASDGGPAPNHAYAAGSYQPGLTVTDDEGCSGTLVFTGQTANCNGSRAASTTRSLEVDGSGPTFVLRGRRKQPLDGSVELKVRQVSEQSTVTATGRLAVAGAGGRSALRAFKLKGATAEVSAGVGAKLKLKERRKARKSAENALEDDGRVKAKITVVATDAVGNTGLAKRTIRLILD